MVRNLTGLFILLLLMGCSGWSKKKCSESNFQAVGYDRGIKGLRSRGDQINATCLKKDVSIDLNAYNNGYQQGLKAYCTEGKGRENGRLGQNPHSTCTGIKHYMAGYDKGLKSFCTVEKGTKDGYSLKPKREVCLAYSQYLVGYKNGVKTYCSLEKGQEDGFSGVEMHTTCAGHSSYTSGYKKGIANFCMPENGHRLGEKGAEFENLFHMIKVGSYTNLTETENFEQEMFCSICSSDGPQPDNGSGHGDHDHDHGHDHNHDHNH